jgi:hypothetical protein
MKKTLLAIAIAVSCANVFAQQGSICRTSEVMAEYYQNNPQALVEKKAFEQAAIDYISYNSQNKTTANDSFVIPVVVHVYGTTQSGYAINDALVKLALKGVNDDFNGLNSDWGTVHNSWLSLRGTIKFRFALAQKDPSGNPTTGIIYYATKSGYGKTTVNAQIAADAWDNFKYMNVYIQNDLYDNAVYNNSGVAWYPDINMSNSKTARVVYNGAYLATNCTVNPEFASVLTHEFSHFFNLIHTFEGGCVAPNDSVSDTPPCTQAQGCHPNATATTPQNCMSQLICAENYMDYNTNCYKMFTLGQVARLLAATEHPARKPLWQESNLIATGIHTASTGVAIAQQVMAQVYPNPSNGVFHVMLKNSSSATAHITDVTGKEVYTTTFNNEADINLQGAAKGMYFMTLAVDNNKQVYKLLVQ